ncbi:MAG: hypothetical protein OXC00_15285, partial [Acidimicrobiaceae bacterium]|nr:hypothetical protein [Acidimicrobiaceae bacterium]
VWSVCSTPSASPWGGYAWTGLAKIMVFIACYALLRELLHPALDHLHSALVSWVILMALILVGSFAWWWTRVRVPRARMHAKRAARILPAKEYGQPQASYRDRAGRNDWQQRERRQQ